MGEFEKMLEGKIYDPSSPDLVAKRTKAHNLSFEFNKLLETDFEKRIEITKELLPNLGENSILTGPIFFDYGINFHTGKNFFCNFNFSCLDVCPVIIGDNVYCGPNVSINTPLHPLLGEERRPYIGKNGQTDKEYGKGIVIGSDCWIASNVTICAGVHIGSNCVIGAGSVVTKDIPDGYLAYGVPAKPIRKLTEKDSIELKKELY